VIFVAQASAYGVGLGEFGNGGDREWFRSGMVWIGNGGDRICAWLL